MAQRSRLAGTTRRVPRAGALRSLACLAIGASVAAFASPALADPCEAIPHQGPTPDVLKPGARFAGPVVYVADGDSLCVAVGKGPSSWVEVRLADFNAPEVTDLERRPWPAGIAAKAALERIAMGKVVQCVAGLRSFDRIAAVCTLGGSSLGDHMRAAGIAEGGWGKAN